MIILAIDASTYTGTVAVAADDEILSSVAAPMRGAAEEHLMPSVASAITDAGLQPYSVEQLVCGSGPGSFTSLRIAASIAKGIALGLGRPLHTLSSLALIVAGGASSGRLGPGRYLAAIDALRGEWYAAPYLVQADGAVTPLEEESPRLADARTLSAWAEELEATLVGPGQRVDAMPDAAGVVRLYGMLRGSEPVDLARWEPAYGRKAEAQVKWEAAHGRPLALG